MSKFDLYDGGAGSDIIYAADNLWNQVDGGAGADEMHGSKGDDTYYVDDAGDRVIEGADGGLFDSVNSFIATMRLARNIEVLYFDYSLGTTNLLRDGERGQRFGSRTADGDDIVDGLGGVYFLFAYGGADTVYGRAGDDYLWGGTGADKLCGGTGKDELVGGFDADRLCGGKGTMFSVSTTCPKPRQAAGCHRSVGWSAGLRGGGEGQGRPDQPRGHGRRPLTETLERRRLRRYRQGPRLPGGQRSQHPRPGQRRRRSRLRVPDRHRGRGREGFGLHAAADFVLDWV